MEPWIPFLVALGLFVVLVVGFRISGTYWMCNIPISFVLAVLFLGTIDHFERLPDGNGQQYVVDGWSLGLASLLATAFIVVVVVFVVVGCRSNPHNKCCICLRMKSQINGAIPYDQVVFYSAASETEVYVDA